MMEALIRPTAFDGAFGIALFDGAGDLPNDALVAHRDHERDVFDGDFASVGPKVEVEFVDLIANLAGFGSSPLDEELERLSLDGEPFLTGNAGDNAGDLFFPAFLRDIDLVEGAVVGAFFGPFPESADAIDASGAQKKGDFTREVVL